MNPELRHLRALVVLAEEGTFTDAAIALRVSQSAVSRTIADLERIVGTSLVVRSTRELSLTDVGERLRGHARHILAEFDRALAEARSGHGEIRLGYSWSALGALTTPVIRGWGARHPDAPLRLQRHNDRHAGLVSGVVDLAVIRNEIASADIAAERVGTESRMCVVSEDHRLAARDRIILWELEEERVAVDRGTGTTSARLWTDRGLLAPPVEPTSDIDEWLDLISAGDAIGVTAESTAHQYPRPGVRFVPLVDAPGIEVKLAWHRERPHPLAAELAAELRAAYGKADAAHGSRAG